MTAGYVVRVYAEGVVNHDQSACTWAVSLVSGEHRRAEPGSLSGAGLDRTQLPAVVEALNRLTRPSVVQIAVKSHYVIRGTTSEQTPSTDPGPVAATATGRPHPPVDLDPIDTTDPEFAELTARADELARSRSTDNSSA